MIMCRALSYEENTLDKSLLTNFQKLIPHDSLFSHGFSRFGMEFSCNFIFLGATKAPAAAAARALCLCVCMLHF